MLCVFTASVLIAQTSENKKATFQLSFVPPLSTNGEYAYQYTKQVSLNLLVGISRNEEMLIPVPQVLTSVPSAINF